MNIISDIFISDETKVIIKSDDLSNDLKDIFKIEYKDGKSFFVFYFKVESIKIERENLTQVHTVILKEIPGTIELRHMRLKHVQKIKKINPIKVTDEKEKDMFL